MTKEKNLYVRELFVTYSTKLSTSEKGSNLENECQCISREQINKLLEQSLNGSSPTLLKIENNLLRNDKIQFFLKKSNQISLLVIGTNVIGKI